MTKFGFRRMEKGDWEVQRNCCTSGLCVVCKDREQRPMRIVHGYGYSKGYAEYVAKGWPSYKAKACKMRNEDGQ